VGRKPTLAEISASALSGPSTRLDPHKTKVISVACDVSEIPRLCRAHLGLELILKSWLQTVHGEFDGLHELHSLHRKLVSTGATESLSSEDAGIMTLLDAYSELRYPNLNQPVEVGTQQRELSRLWTPFGRK
jgi:hypothetical protein